MSDFPYCKSKQLEVEHLPGYRDSYVKATKVEFVLKTQNVKLRELKKQIEQMREDINRTYAAEQGG